MKKRFISLFVSVCLLLANFSSSAFAEILQLVGSPTAESSESARQAEAYDPFSSDFFANPQINPNAKSYTYTDIALNTSYTVNVNTGGEGRYFRFIPASNGFYTFESSASSSVNPVAALYNSSIQSISSHDNVSNSYNFRLVHYFIANMTYYFAAGSYPNAADDSYSVMLKPTASHTHIPASDLPLGGSALEINYANEGEIYEITPTTTGAWIFFSSNSDGNPGILLYNSSMSLIGYNDNGGGDYNFRLRVTLTANQTYYLVLGHSGSSSGDYSFYAYAIADVPTAVYYVQNIGSEKYMDVHGPAEETYVHQWTFSTAPQKKWTIQKQSDGYYTIRSQYGNKKYVGIANSNTDENNIQLYSSISDNAKWTLMCLSNGAMLFEPKSAIGKILYAPNNVTGTELRLFKIEDFVIDTATWSFAVKSDTTLEGQQMSYWCWAASARMLVNHYYDVPSSRTQSFAVQSVFGSIINSGGNHAEAISAASAYRSNNTNANELNLVGDFGKILSENTLKQFLNDGHVIYIARGSYDLNNIRNGGHASVVVGYSVKFNEGEPYYTFIIFDPWPEAKPNPWESVVTTQGQEYECSYQWICNGRNGLSGDGYDTRIWDKYVAVNTAYSNNTINPIWN